MTAKLTKISSNSIWILTLMVLLLSFPSLLFFFCIHGASAHINKSVLNYMEMRVCVINDE